MVVGVCCVSMQYGYVADCWWTSSTKLNLQTETAPGHLLMRAGAGGPGLGAALAAGGRLSRKVHVPFSCPACCFSPHSHGGRVARPRRRGEDSHALPQPAAHSGVWLHNIRNGLSSEWPHSRQLNWYPVRMCKCMAEYPNARVASAQAASSGDAGDAQPAEW